MESKEVTEITNDHQEENHVDNNSTGTINNTATSTITDLGEETQVFSKTQSKKMLKRQMWIDNKVERRKKEKEKLKERMKAKKAAGEPCGNIRKKLKETTMLSSSCKQRVVVDMSFDELMIEKHLAQCVKQISRCYSANRRVINPMQFYVTSFKGKCEEIMARQEGYKHWDVNFKTENYTDLFTKENLIYLSSDSKNVITSLDENKVYVIGGLVDHNKHKGLCLKLAKEKGIKHARLPIDEFIQMKTRKVLTVDHVYRILLGVTEGKSWKEAFLDNIPPRKGAVAKNKDDCDDSVGENIFADTLPNKSESNSPETTESLSKEANKSEANSTETTESLNKEEDQENI